MSNPLTMWNSATERGPSGVCICSAASLPGAFSGDVGAGMSMFIEWADDADGAARDLEKGAAVFVEWKMIRSLFAATWFRLRSECSASIWFDSEAAASSTAHDGGQRLFCGMSSVRVSACMFGVCSGRSSRRSSL